MADSLEPDTKRNIFDVDMPCPRCGYNLRGIREPRCPECGTAFEPVPLLATYRLQRKASPPARWVAWSVLLRHRSAFWEQPEIRYSRGPSLWQNLAVLVLTAALCTMVLGSVEIPYGGRFAAGQILPSIAQVTGILVMAMSLHGVLCRAGLKMLARHPHSAAMADVLVGYPLWWLVPTAPLLVGQQLAQEVQRRQGLFKVPFLLQPWEYLFSYWLLAVALVVCCLCWLAITYRGAMRVTRGSRVTALWCALCNPLPWLAAAGLASWRLVQHLPAAGHLLVTK